MYHRRFSSHAGFTLFEVLMVISIVSLIAGFTVPALRSTSSQNLHSGARLVAGWLNVARSEAIARHTIVRFAVAREWPGKTGANLRKVSLWAWDAELESFWQISPWQELPPGLVIEPEIPAYVRGALYATNDPSATRGDCVLGEDYASTAGFETGPSDQPVEVRFVEFTAAGNARVPGSTERQAIFVVTPGSADADGVVTHTTNAGGHAANWAQINIDKLTGRVRVYEP